MIGKSIGNYKIVDRLGAGGMGEVYRARDGRLDRDVAIKVLPPAFAADAERLARFEREAKLLAGLSHPNIGSIFGIEEADGATVLVLELVEGEDLSQRLARGPMSVDDTLDIAHQIAEALEAAHEQGIIHRDLKPANVVVSSGGRAKVLDFGLAKALETDNTTATPDLSNSPTAMASSPTVAGVILGTAAYMSPEQARGKVVDKRSDIFAFGAVLWEMLTGRQLFAGDSGDTVSDVLAAVLRATPDYSELPAGVPPALRRLIERCLQKDAKSRLRDIGEARIALDDIRAGNLGDAAAPATMEKPGMLSRVLGLSGWIATAVVAVVLMMMMRQSGPIATSDAPLPLLKFTIPMSSDDPSASSGFDPCISPNGRYLVYVSDNQLWLRDFSSPDANPIAGTEGALKPFWSPDESAIGFGLGQKIQRIPREGGRPALVATFTGGMMLGAGASAAWDIHDRIVASTAQSALFEMPAHGGSMKEFLVPADDETDFHEVSALPDGRGWLFVIHNTSGIGNMDALTPDGTRHTLLRIEDNISDAVWSPSGHVLFTRSGATSGVWALPISLEALNPTGEPFLVAAGGSGPSVSSNGTLTYSRGIHSGHGQLTWFDRDGTQVGTLGPSIETSRPFPAISADGSRVLLAETFGDSRETFLYDVASGNRRRLTFDDLRDDMAFFHPNGTDIITYDSGSYTTRIRPLDASAEPRVIENAIMVNVTSDGSTLVASRKAAESWVWEIHTMPADGSGKSTAIVSTGGVDWWPRLSPDDRYLAYVSDETGRNEVYITTFPGATTRWQVSSGGGEWPQWRADGGELYYTDRGRIMAVTVDIGAGLTLGTPVQLFSATTNNWSSRWADGFAVTADGQRFLVVDPVKSDADASPAIVVVQNWFAEFEK